MKIKVSRENLNKLKGAINGPFFLEEELPNAVQNSSLNQLLTEILTKKAVLELETTPKNQKIETEREKKNEQQQ